SEKQDKPVATEQPGAVEVALEVLDDVAPVWELSQRIVHHADRGEIGLADVHHRAGESNRFSFSVAARLAAREHPAPAAVLVPEAMLALESRGASGEMREDRRLQRLPIRGMDAIEPFRGRLALALRSHDRAPRIRQPE